MYTHTCVHVYVYVCVCVWEGGGVDMQYKMSEERNITHTQVARHLFSPVELPYISKSAVCIVKQAIHHVKKAIYIV